MKFRFKAALSILLSAAMLSGSACIGVAAAGDDQDNGETVVIRKISNPDAGERQIDGLIEGGDRGNSYAWRLAARGDYIYIATARNIASALINMYADAFEAQGLTKDELWAALDLITSGDIERNDDNQGANIISYNRKTGKFDVVYTADKGIYFRMAVTYGDNVYFGSYSADPSASQFILRLDPRDKITKVFETTGSVSMRANCVYDGHLFFAGADARETLDEGVNEEDVTKMAVLRMSNEDDTVWDRVADYRDFGEYPFDPIMKSWAGAPIWELASHNGYIYATAPSSTGFVVFRGHPAADGEQANEYGWYWEEVVGDTNPYENSPGLLGGSGGQMCSLIGSVYEFKGELYAYNFDHAFGSEAAAFAGMAQKLGGADIKASDYLQYMYETLQTPQKVWKLNDETEKFEECTEFTKLVENTTNEYVWRMGTYDDKLYISTMDAGIFYGYLADLTNGSFLLLSKEDRAEKIAYLKNLVKVIVLTKHGDQIEQFKSKLEMMIKILSMIDEEALIDATSAALLDQYADLAEELKVLASDVKEELIELLVNVLDKLSGKETEQLPAQPESANGQQENGDASGSRLDTLRNAVAALFGKVMSADEFHKVMDKVSAVREKLSNSIVSSKVREMLTKLADKWFGKYIDKVSEIFDAIDIKGLRMYRYIQKTIKNDPKGFDLYCTEDGQSFDTITTNGFGDKYNYGCPSFLETEEGLYFGTCNPFYGAQLYLLTNYKPLINDSFINKTNANIGETVRISMAATGGLAPYTYAYYYKNDADDDWTKTGIEFGTSESASFKVTKAGNYQIRTVVRDSEGNETERLFTVKVKSEIENTSSLNTSKAQIGDDVRINGAAENCVGPVRYSYYFKRSVNTKWNLIGTADTKSTSATLVPKAAADYDIKVIATDSTGASSEKIMRVTVVEKMALVNLAVINSDNTIAIGNTVTISGRCVGGVKPVTYEFYFKRSANTKWNQLKYGNEKHTYAKFTPTAAASYDLKCVARAADGTTAEKVFTVSAVPQVEFH